MLNRKLNRPSDQRKALLRNQVTGLIWNGKIETTLARAKEVQSVAERLITLAARECENTVEVTKETRNEKEQIVPITVTNDLPSRLAARRRLIGYLYNVPAKRNDKESKSDYKERTGMINNPVVEKLMREIGPKYRERAKQKGIGGGYTRIVRIGPRRGDAAEMVLLELV